MTTRYGMIASEKQQENVLFFITYGHRSVYYVFFSKTQGYELVEDIFGGESDAVKKCREEIQRSELPKDSNMTLVTLRDAASYLLDNSIEKLKPNSPLRTGKFKNLLLASSDTPDGKRDRAGLLSFSSRGIATLYVFFSIDQGLSILNEYNRMFDRSTFDQYKQQIKSSRLPKATQRAKVRLNGYLARYIGSAIETQQEKLATCLFN